MYCSFKPEILAWNWYKGVIHISIRSKIYFKCRIDVNVGGKRVSAKKEKKYLLATPSNELQTGEEFWTKFTKMLPWGHMLRNEKENNS